MDGRRRPRLTIAERAARRQRVTASRDRYASLLRALRAGREIPLEAHHRWRFALYGTEVRLALVGAAGSLVALAAWHRFA